MRPCAPVPHVTKLTRRATSWWGKLLENRGVAALLETATTDEKIPERLLSLHGADAARSERPDRQNCDDCRFRHVGLLYS